MKIFSARFLRPAALLCVFVGMLATSTHQRIYSRGWAEPLPITIFPINGDSTLETHNYILGLKQADFDPISDWFAREAVRHGLGTTRPVDVRLGQTVKKIPPRFPPQAGVLRTVFWGLHLRTWVAFNTPDDTSNLRRVRVFVIYQKGEDGVALAHSIGLEKGLIGMVNAFSDVGQNAQNNIVIAHELLHTVGATDKYDDLGNPLFPVGYANPGRTPVHPQRYAEIMAARVPLTPYSSHMAVSLRSTKINQITANEIDWLR